MKANRLVIEALEPRLVLDSMGVGGALFDPPLEVPAGSQIASTVGVAEVGQERVFVEVLFLVPPGANVHQTAAEAVRAQGARPLQSAEYVLTGLVWDEFFDADPGNDFVDQYYNPTNDPTGGGYASLVASQHTWTDVASSSFVFNDGGTTTRDPSLVRESPGPQYLDGFNDVGWARLAPGTLGVTWFQTGPDEADMALNTRYRWSTSGSPGPNEIDLETVMLHENGHVVGLGHSDDPGSVMQAYYGGVQRTLGQDDIDGITAKYPSGPVTPVTDLAITAVAAPSSVSQGDSVDVQVTVRNVGNQDVTSNVDVSLAEIPGGFPFSDQVIAGLSAGASEILTFSWDTASAEIGLHTLTASITFSDDNAANNTMSTTVSVNQPTAGVTVASISSPSIPVGTTQDVTILGAGFAGGAQVTFENGSGPAPVASNVIVVDASTITATITAKSGGPPHDRVWDVRVTNPDGATGVLPGGLTVTVSSSPLTQPDPALPTLGDRAALDEIARFYATLRTSKDLRSSHDRDAVARSVDYVLQYLL